jgi:hypothetical protein
MYGSNAFVLPETPDCSARIVEEVRLRGRRLIVLEIHPLNYRPLSGTIRILSSARIVIRCSGSDSAATRQRIARYTTPGYDRLARDLILNAASFERALGGGMHTNGRGSCYLMICAPAFTGNAKLQDLITLRTSEGYDVTLVDTNTTGTSAADIQGYIQLAYDTWVTPPESVLLIGDTDTIPCFTGQGVDTPPTDLYFACVDGNDYVPDIMRGRFPVRTDTHLNNLIAKIIANASNTVEKAVFMASNDVWTQSEGAHNYVIDNYMDFAGWTSDKLYCHTYNATTQQVTSALNDGRSIACYQGHGTVTAWVDGPPFYKTNVQNLTNTVYPLVLSFACLTGQYTRDECFGETWVRDDGGATSFFGASVVSYWNHNNALEKRIFKGCFNYGYGRIGAMIDFGQYEVYLNWGGTQSTRQGYYEMYNLLGDPVMDVIVNGGVRIPFPDVKINGQDGPLTVPQGTALSMTIGLDPGNFEGMVCDWWVWASTPISPYGSFWWRPGQGWTGSYMPIKAYNGALFSFSDLLIGSFSSLPAGSYRMTFALDEPDGVYEATYLDTFDLIIN